MRSIFCGCFDHFFDRGVRYTRIYKQLRVGMVCLQLIHGEVKKIGIAVKRLEKERRKK